MTLQRHPSRRALTFAAAAAGLGAALIAAPGCNILGFGGAMIDSYRRSSTKTVHAEYTGLAGKNYAVLVIADRYLQADHPSLVPYLTSKISGQMSAKDAQSTLRASGYIPADRLLEYLYEHPRWTAMPRAELAKELGVQRLVIVELQEYRLNDPGNQYIWDGLATGSVGVCEVDGPAPDEFAFEKPIRVAFPDKQGMGPNDLSMQAVATELGRRFVDRASWLFYDHQEKYYPDY
jgi:hypothetical protein